MSEALRVQWTITPKIPPQPWLVCNRCRASKPFRCSGKFRLNANGKRLDAWLIYGCSACDNTWNRPVIERLNRRDIDPQLLRALEANDPGWIRRYAFDVASLANKAERIEQFADVDIEKRLLAPASKQLSALEILLSVPVPTCLRTDRLLAGELGLSRSRIENLAAEGRLTISAGPHSLRRSVRDGTTIVLHLEEGVDCEEIAQTSTGSGPET